MTGTRLGTPQSHKQPFPHLDAEDLAWEADAACRDYPPDLFYPERGGHAGKIDAEKAIAVCRSCPLHAVIGCARKAANAGAIASNRHGVWAGVYYGNGSRQQARAHEQILRIAALNPEKTDTE